MVADRLDRLLATVHDVQHTRGKAGLLSELNDLLVRERILLARLEHYGIARRNRVWPEPERNHDREIIRGDDSEDAEWLPPRSRVDPLGDLLHGVAHHQSGNATRVFDILDAPLHLATRLGQDLPVFSRELDSQLFFVLFQ